MAWIHPEWEDAAGVRILRICGNPGPGHEGNEHWPRVVLMDLSSEQFNKFQDEPLQFAREYKLFPEQEILWMCDCAKPAVGKGIPEPAPGTRWLVAVNHGKFSVALAAACPVDFRNT